VPSSLFENPAEDGAGAATHLLVLKAS
jgi:hypothetical protein